MAGKDVRRESHGHGGAGPLKISVEKSEETMAM